MKTTGQLFLFLSCFLLIFCGNSSDARAEIPHVPVPGGLGNKTCYDCHISKSSPFKKRFTYSVTEAYETYYASPHGRLLKLGNPKAPTCADCHLTSEWKYILPVEHPESPVHPDNLAKVCVKCHGENMLTAKVNEGSMHFALNRRSLLPGEAADSRYGFLKEKTKKEQYYYIGSFDLTAYVDWAYKLLILITLSCMAIYMVIDLYRRIRSRISKGGDS